MSHFIKPARLWTMWTLGQDAGSSTPLIPSVCTPLYKTNYLERFFFLNYNHYSHHLIRTHLMANNIRFPHRVYPLFLTSKKNCHNLPCLSTLTSSNTEIRYKIKIKEQPKGENNKGIKKKRNKVDVQERERDSILLLYYVGMQVVQGGNGLNPASQHTQTGRRGRRGGKERGRRRHTAMRKRVRANDGIDQP